MFTKILTVAIVASVNSTNIDIEHIKFIGEK